MLEFKIDEITLELLEELYPKGTYFIPYHIASTKEDALLRDAYLITKDGGFVIDRQETCIHVSLKATHIQTQGKTSWSSYILNYNFHSTSWGLKLKIKDNIILSVEKPNITIIEPEKIVKDPIKLTKESCSKDDFKSFIDDLENISSVPRDIGILLEFTDRAEMIPVFKRVGTYLTKTMWNDIVSNGNYFNTRTLTSHKNSIGLDLKPVPDFLKEFNSNSINTVSQRYSSQKSEWIAENPQSDFSSKRQVSPAVIPSLPTPIKSERKQLEKISKLSEVYGAYPLTIQEAYEDVKEPTNSNEIPILGILPINNYKS